MAVLLSSALLHGQLRAGHQQGGAEDVPSRWPWPLVQMQNLREVPRLAPRIKQERFMMNNRIPSFEGQVVDATSIKMSGAMPVESIDEDTVLYLDDIVQLVTQFRVVGVRHDMDDKTGNLIRVQTLRPIEAMLAPFDASDPDDIGILRSPKRLLASRPATSKANDPFSIKEDGEDYA